MEILYLYIREHLPIIKEQGFNFGGKYRFSYDKNLQELTVRENPTYIERFFSNPNSKGDRAELTNVTAIIGDNGVGKSSILNFLKGNLVSGLNGIQDPLIIVIENDQKKLIAYHFSDIPISSGNYAHYNIEIVPLANITQKIQSSVEQLRFETINRPTISDFNAVDFIHFSNIFDGKQELQWSGIFELSTNYLIRNDLINNLENRIINSQVGAKEIETHIFEEIERQIAFINGFKNSDIIPFNLPEFLFISSKRDLLNMDFALDRSEKSTLEEYGFLDVVDKVIEVTQESIQAINQITEKVEQYFVGLTFVNFLIEIATSYNAIKSHSLFTISSSKISFSEGNVKQIALSVISELKKQNETFQFPLDARTIGWMDSILDFIEYLPTVLREPLITSNQPTSFVLNIKEEKDQFKAFYEKYARTFILRPYLNFSWRNLSTGEKAFLNLYARFFSLSNNQLRADNIRLKRTIIVLIDEGDIYFHPAWQKQFVNNLIEYLTLIFSSTENGEKRNMQIVFTTNSPIPASDLPTSNIIFLKRDNGSTITVDSLEDKKPTFGANIHTLLADSFFLKDGLIGDFARNKINHVIELLQEDIETIKLNQIFIEKVISIIGEPVIKSKLTQMLNERLALNTSSLFDQVSKLTKRVSDLENRLNSSDNNNQ